MVYNINLGEYQIMALPEPTATAKQSALEATMFGKATILAVLVALGTLSACSSPVKGAAVADTNATTPTTTTTTTEPSRPSAEPTTTTTAPTTTTTPAAPPLPFAIEGLLTGAELYSATKVPEFAHDLRPQIGLTPPGMRGQTARYDGMRASVYLTVVVEESGNSLFGMWRSEAIKDGVYDPETCGIPNKGFCSGDDPAKKGQPGGPDTATFTVAGVKGAGTVTVRIKLTNIVNPNYVSVLHDLSKLVNDRLPK